jgi:DNA mismatch repair protein MutS
MSAKDTPVMRQHAEAKRAHPHGIVFFRLGDFYEMFGEDAVFAAKALDLVLTSRNKGAPDEIPMCGVPHHAAHGHIARLLELGKSVALCEQLADPAKCKGIVPREIVRIISPGMTTDREYLQESVNNWLMTLELAANGIGLSLLDISTGDFSTTALADSAEILAEVCRTRPREIIVGRDAAEDIEDIVAPIRLILPSVAIRKDEALTDAEPAWALPADGTADLSECERRAAARALRMARSYHPGRTVPVERVVHFDRNDGVIVDEIAQRHLELVESSNGDRLTTLLNVIDQTCSPMGARLLRRWLLAPLRDVPQIRRRLDRVELFLVQSRLRASLREALKEIGDLERLATRAALREATPRDLGAIRDGLVAASRVFDVLQAIELAADRETLGLLGNSPDLVPELLEELQRALVERPPAQPKDGAIFRSEYDALLNECDELRRSGTERIVAMEAALRAETGINSLKLRYTRVFGWYAEVSRGQISKVPSEWRRKQTVASGERYTFTQLDELADRILHAEERHRERELELLEELVGLAAAASSRIRSLASSIASIDVAVALAEVAHRFDYCRPTVDNDDTLEIEDGRHPVVERLAAKGRFVPNNCGLCASAERMWLLTGPNMAGKSTFLRQTALCVILAQMGSFVPASSMRVGVVDRILSRVGASDNLARGESTFMVEMRETSRILRTATRRSLVVLDEIGRGTSTFDGLAIAWAVGEYLDQAVGCRVLFATHYHELTELARASEHIGNRSVSAQESNGELVFLHRLVEGAVSHSYGVAVAKLAGLPDRVLARARELLASFEADPPANVRKPRTGGAAVRQLGLFAQVDEQDAVPRSVIEELRHIQVERMTPMEALATLDRWKQRLAAKSS